MGLLTKKEDKGPRFMRNLRSAGLFRYAMAMAVKIPKPEKNYRQGKWLRKRGIQKGVMDANNKH